MGVVMMLYLYGVIVVFYAEEILEPNGMGGVVELFIVVIVNY
jgi:hypothetical protein